MSRDWQPGDFVFRQVHPSHRTGEHPNSVAFFPTPKDKDLLSVDDSSLVSAEGSWSHFTKALGFQSAGTWAKDAGVMEPRDYAIFQNHGYLGLYGGLGAQDIHDRKGSKKREQILDHMGSTELAANLFRATQTEEKLRREKIAGKAKANQTHREVGAKVRQPIKELGGCALATGDQQIHQELRLPHADAGGFLRRSE